MPNQGTPIVSEDTQTLFVAEAFKTGAAYDLFSRLLADALRELLNRHDALTAALKKREGIEVALQAMFDADGFYGKRLNFVWVTILGNQKSPGKTNASKEHKGATGGEKTYPGQRYGLTALQSNLSLSEFSFNGHPLALREFNLLKREGIQTLGELVEYAKGSPKRLVNMAGVGTTTLKHFEAIFAAYPTIEGLTKPDKKEGKAKDRGKSRQGKGKKSKISAAGTSVGMSDKGQADESWLNFGLTQTDWDKRLKDLFPKGMGRKTNKARRLVGRKPLTIGELCLATELKTARIGKYFGRGCGPDTRRFIQQTVLALAAPEIRAQKSAPATDVPKDTADVQSLT